MAEVFVSAQTGAQVVVFSHDHCPPHVSALKRRDAWTARVGFSFVTDEVALWDIEPLRNAPRRRDIAALLDEVQDRLPACRRHWWSIHRTTCLAGRLAAKAGGGLILLSRRRAEVRQVMASHYNAASEDLTVVFRDGSALTTKAGTGIER